MTKSPKIAFLSDTHGKHKQIDVPDADLLVHAGDFTGRGLPWQVREFFEWLRELPHRYKVVIAGNHDFMAQDHPKAFLDYVPDNVIYLNDSGTEIEGLKIWGSPVTPWFHDWAFNRQRGAEIRKHWDLIPDDTDLLVTHGPPADRLDRTARGEAVGCADLLAAVQRVRPRVHVFGHIHEAYGRISKNGTAFINASNLDLGYQPVNAAWTMEWPGD